MGGISITSYAMPVLLCVDNQIFMGGIVYSFVRFRTLLCGNECIVF